MSAGAAWGSDLPTGVGLFAGGITTSPEVGDRGRTFGVVSGGVEGTGVASADAMAGALRELRKKG